MELAKLMSQESAREYRRDSDAMPEVDRLRPRADHAADSGVYCMGLDQQASMIYRRIREFGGVRGSLKHEI